MVVLIVCILPFVKVAVSGYMTRCHKSGLAAFATVLICLHSSPCPGQELDKVDEMLDFARELQERQLYFQAVSEFERARFFSKDLGHKFAASVGIADSYFLGRQYRRATNSYRDAAELAPDSESKTSVLLNLAVASCEDAKESQDTGNLVASLDNMVELSLSPIERQAVFSAFHVARFSVYLDDFDQAKRFSKLAVERCTTPGSDMCEAALELERRLAKGAPKKKYPGLGLALSAVFPGGGALYSEHYFDALFYFLGTTSAGLLAWDVYDGDRSLGNQKATFFTMLGVGAAIYIGNLVQGYVSVERLNVSNRYKYIKHINGVFLSPADN
jgi:hypothetical protein